MKKNKKIIIGVLAILVVIAIIVVIVMTSSGKDDNGNEQGGVEKNYGIDSLRSLSTKLSDTKNYSFYTELNEENFQKTSRNNNSIQVETDDEGEKQTYIVKDGTTYLLIDNSKKYYEYENNTSILNELENKVNELLRNKYNTGTEKIEGKEYTYEEYEKTSSFLINYKKSVDNNNTKTRFYFKDGNLKYIKTYVGEIEQLLKVNLTFNNQNGEYKIPEEYSK